MDHAAELGEIASRSGLRIAVAESLTSGQIATTLGATSGSGEWFRGALVAYSREVKHRVLDVPPGPVVSEPAARAMAAHVRELFAATLAIGVTGAGGPDGQDGADPGTVWFAIATEDSVRAWQRVFGGEPTEVLAQTVDHAVESLLAAARECAR
ncbi:CinA family protein [Nocardia paucivorans]|uniref:CinA family protein n=1 Tax=Nocardia paucivorans TaxID=114259 RepID=UPI0003158DFF|nr:CinA family protein [Nocardia paucivorans]